jgi:hypothetical protein
MATVEQVLDIARARIGVSEEPMGSNSVPGITDWYGMRGAWCAMFVSRTFYDAGMPIPASTDKGFAWVSAGFDYMRSKGWNTNQPKQAKPGALLAFQWGTTPGGYDHIGIVEEVRENGLVTIEGNVGDKVQRLWRSWDSGIAEVANPPFEVTPTSQKGRIKMFAFTTVDKKIVQFGAVFGCVVHRWQSVDNGGFGPWTPLYGGQPFAVDSVDAVANADGRLDVVAWNSSTSQTCYRTQDVKSGAWRDWRVEA